MNAACLLEPQLKETIQQGAFVKHCPCSPGAVPCGYYNLNLQTGCPFDCSYCILQAYLENKDQGVFFSNRNDLERELEKFLSGQKQVRIGSGELSDSLAYENLRPNARSVLELFRRFPDVVFEFKTKATLVRPLLEVEEVPRNVVVSWSLNPSRISAREERLAPSLARRLQALVAVQEKGYKIGIHFDPLILCPGWKDAYRELIAVLARFLRPAQIAWWSLGALRFPPALKKHIFAHPGSRLFWGELVPDTDGKYRYFKPLRLELFRFVKEEIVKQVSGEVPLYLCMEDAGSWREIIPEIPAKESAINRRLYASARRRPAR